MKDNTVIRNQISVSLISLCCATLAISAPIPPHYAVGITLMCVAIPCAFALTYLFEDDQEEEDINFVPLEEAMPAPRRYNGKFVRDHGKWVDPPEALGRGKA